jgi:Ser/Thr protein kinase RdoA (MazF antagonist)
MSPPIQYGLEWKDGRLGIIAPQWSAEPSLAQIEQISRQHFHLDDTATCLVKFYTQGSSNKLYTVSTDTGRWLMRVALPMDPYRKTSSEVATMRYVQKNTSIPVPAVLGYEASNDNALQFEWMLIQYMPGTVLEQRWRKMSLSTKEDLVKKLAHFQSELFSKTPRFQAIGNLYQKSPESSEIGSLVSTGFFWGDRGARAQDINRGPFRNNHQWLSARLNLVLQDQAKILAKSNDEDEIEDAQTAKNLAERLLALLPSIFRADEAVESTILYHDDLHESDILIDESSNITAVLDWECVSFFPLWMACQPPAFLNGGVRLDEPQRRDFSAYNPELDDGDAEVNEGLSSVYWRELKRYEVGKLRTIFLAEMERLQPDWLKEHRDGEVKRDFELAVWGCDVELTMKRVGLWLDAYEKGKTYSLRESLNK